jgi:hypothetical protein
MQHMKRFFGSFLMAVAGVLFWCTNAFALSLSPPVLEYSARPGDAVIDAVRVFNDTDKAVTIYPSSLNATDAGDELGTPKFYPVNQDVNGQSMAAWLSLMFQLARSQVVIMLRWCIQLRHQVDRRMLV